MEGLLFQAVIYLAAAVIAVPIANRVGLGSVLGYLIAGIIIGPALNIVGAETQSLQQYAEFGVVMMLFLIGLELDPSALWAMRTRLLGLGGMQIVLTTTGISIAGWLLGLQPSTALAVGMVLTLSSTAIVMQTLSEKGLSATEGGRAGFSVLLAQDIAVIPMLALFPLLALPELAGLVDQDAGGHGHGGSNLLETMPGWAAALIVLGSVVGIVAGGHYLTRPIFRFIASARLQEIFTAAALLLVVGIALLMSKVGLSPALGTFLAGVVLANSEYRHELESNIAPFKGLLLGLFFITVGAGMDFDLFLSSPAEIMGLAIGLMVLKFLVLLVLAHWFKLKDDARWLFTLSLAQAGEFSFVMLSFTLQNGVIPGDLGAKLALVVAFSMLLTPGLFIFYDKVIAPRFDVEKPPDDEIDKTGTVIIAGLGRFGQIVNRMMLSEGHRTIVVDYRNETISGLRKFGVEGFFGDASRPALLQAAGINEAKVLVVAIDDRDKAVEMVRYVARDYPHVHIVARAYDRIHTFQLYAAGAREIVRETFDSALRAGKYTLNALGHHPFEIEKSAKVFSYQDRQNLAELAAHWDPETNLSDNQAYVAKARELNAELNASVQGLRTEFHDRSERSWAPPPKERKPRDET